MKFIFLLFFAGTVPVVIFLITLLYGGISAKELKQNLASSSIYNSIDGLIPSDASNDPQENQLDAILKNRLTPSYVQSKTEKVIDDSSAWISGKSKAPPVLSLKEIKDDINAQNPDLLTQLQTLQDEVQKQQADAAAQNISPTPNGNEPNLDFIKSINALVKSDFSINLEHYFAGLKGFYTAARIALPVLALLLLGSLLGIYLRASSLRSKLLWIGSTCITSSVLGFGIVLGNAFIMAVINQLAQNNTNKIVSMFSPIATAIIKQFFTTYTHTQNIANSVFIVIGFIAIIISFTAKQKEVIISNKSKKKKI